MRKVKKREQNKRKREKETKEDRHEEIVPSSTRRRLGSTSDTYETINAPNKCGT